MLKSGDEVVVSVAPSFIGSFAVGGFGEMSLALRQLGFAYAEETAVGAKTVTDEYVKLLNKKIYKNFITSACPAINRMIQLYYPSALKYLAPVVSPMVAHAKILKRRFPRAKIVFAGPCIAKKREAEECGIIDAVLTFEELQKLFDERGIAFTGADAENTRGDINRAKYYPISRGIIKSFDRLPAGYEYVAVDGVKRSFEVLEDIDAYSNLFIEINCCEYACVNGPCIVKQKGGAIKANESVREYVKKAAENSSTAENVLPALDDGEADKKFSFIGTSATVPCERDIRAVLSKTGKFKPEDELNCGACGYSTCREKAVAVINGYADIEMCLPYMRTRAESMSYEIIQNSPNGIVVMDNDYKIIEYNSSAKKILGIEDVDAKGKYAYDCFEIGDFVLALNGGTNVVKKKIRFAKSGKYAETTIVVLPEHKILFGIFKDITNRVEYGKKLNDVKQETLGTTDEVIKKQMRVAQEIASLLGETTAETKVALLKLKKTLMQSEDDGE
jgi:PAS domain S-box-containing protein